jgi:hypothetical protein
MSDSFIKQKSNRGGHRPGAGRPPGSKNKINTATTETVLEMLYDKTGRVYEDLLLEDFLKARATNDALAHKYHHLLASKLMPDLNRIEINESEDSVAAKALAFQEALRKLADLDQSTK